MKSSSIKKELASHILEENRFGKAMEIEMIEGFLKRLQVGFEKNQENESPDFFVSLNNGKKIGLEFTLYYNDSKIRGSNGRAIFEKWSKIANKLKEKFLKNKSGLKYWYGAVSFKKKKQKLSDLDIDKFVEEIFLFCIKTLNRNRKEKCFNISDFRESSYLKKFIDGIHFHNTFPESGVLWWHSALQSGAVPSPNSSLYKIIGNKNKIAQKNYKKNADYLILVICARALSLCDFGVLLEDDLAKLKKIKQSVFDIIYFWDKFSENIFEIYPKQRIVLDCGKKSIYISRIPNDFQIKRNIKKDKT